MGELFQLSYPYPRYFWYLLRDHWENKDKERRLYFFLKYGRHQFPYNRENLNYLLRLIGSLQPAYYCSAYEKILRCMGRNVPDDCTHEHYVTMVDDVCRCANLPVSPRLYEIMNIAKHASPMELNLQPYYDYATVFYGAGYYQQTKEDVLDVLRCWRGKSLKPKRLMFMAFMLRSLEKRQPGSIKALETHDDAKLSEWVREADKDPAYFFLCN